jgi:hypothetical protein
MFPSDPRAGPNGFEGDARRVDGFTHALSAGFRRYYARSHSRDRYRFGVPTWPAGFAPAGRCFAPRSSGTG